MIHAVLLAYGSTDRNSLPDRCALLKISQSNSLNTDPPNNAINQFCAMTDLGLG